MLNLCPSYLFIGSEKEIYDYLNENLKRIFCKSCNLNSKVNSYNICNICKKIDTKKHESIRFLEPDGQYTIAQLELIFNTIIFKLDQGCHYFFIINKAELLNLNCSNSLLKVLEEPPYGYHFILITSRLEAILETIRSRCIIKDFSEINQPDELSKDLLFKAFINIDYFNINELKEIENVNIPNYLIPNLLDRIYNYFFNDLKKAVIEKNDQKINYLIRVLDVLDFNKNQYPMPGSSKIFLRSLYLQLINI